MKHLGIAASAAVFALLLTSCSQVTAPVACGPQLTSAVKSQLTSSVESRSTSTQTDIDFWLYNTCCDELVHITGTEHFVGDEGGILGSDRNGGKRHRHLHINYQNLVGTTESGKVYHGNWTRSDERNMHDDGGVITRIDHFVFASPDGCTMKLTRTLHLTIDANGNIRVERSEWSTECLYRRVL